MLSNMYILLDCRYKEYDLKKSQPFFITFGRQKKVGLVGLFSWVLTKGENIYNQFFRNQKFSHEESIFVKKKRRCNSNEFFLDQTKQPFAMHILNAKKT